MKFYESKYFVPVFLIALTILAAAIRLFHISNNNFFIDEMWGVYVNTQPLWMIGSLDVHPFLSYLLIRIPLTLFGTSEWSARIVPCIFGIASVPLTYWFSKEVTGDKFPSLIAAILMTVSIFEIEQSDNARMYTFLTIFSLLAMIYFIKVFRENKPKDWYIFTAFCILMIFTWYYSVIFIGATILWYFLREGKKPLHNKGFLYSAITFVFAAVLMIPSFMVAWSLKLQENNNLVYVGWEVIYQVGITFLGSPPIMALIIAIITFAGWIFLVRDNKDTGSYLGFLVFVSLAAGALISFVIMILPRYFFFFAPVFYTLIGFFVWQVYKSQKIEWKGFVAALFILMIVLATFCMVLPDYFAVQHNYSGNFDDMKDSFHQIKGNATEVAMIGNPAFVMLYQYYIKDPSINVTRFDNLTRMKMTIQGKESLVMVPDYAIPTDQPEAQVIYDWLQTNGKLETTYRGFQVYRVDYNGN